MGQSPSRALRAELLTPGGSHLELDEVPRLPEISEKTQSVCQRRMHIELDIKMPEAFHQARRSRMHKGDAGTLPRTFKVLNAMRCCMESEEVFARDVEVRGG